MGISFGSINTGLPKDIVKQIMEAEKIPLKKMEGRKEKVNAKKKLVDELIGLVNGMRGDLLASGNARSLRELTVNTRDDLVNVTVDKNKAEPGTYQLEIVQLAQKSTAMTSGFEDPDNSYVGVGYIQYSLPDGSSRDIYIDSDNSSLRGVAKLINQNNDAGVTATVINDGKGTDTPWRLIMSLKETGDEQIADFPYMYFVDGEDDFYLEYERKAHDAIVKVDGFEIEVDENTINDVVPGATIDLKKAAPGDEFSITIGEDIQAVSEKITGIIEKINAVLGFIKTQNTLDEKSDTTKTLGGDITLQNLESRIRSVIFQQVDTAQGWKRIGDLGITFNRDGLIQLDDKKLDAAIAKDYNSVSQVLTGWFPPGSEGKSDGFIDNLKEVVSTVLRNPDGLLTNRKNTFQSRIKQIDRRIEQKQRTLEQKEKNLKNKFARLESTIAKIKNQGAGIAALGAGGPNPVTQLG
ncbi:MAG: flagellar filament capping protein FliD [Halobacteriovoraceae bacterium]|nr:flagellar filament capping protein FliD [Halobacteriovoraceae bacterium]